MHSDSEPFVRFHGGGRHLWLLARRGYHQNLCALTWNMSHATHFNFFPSLPHAQSRESDSCVPVSATAFPWHVRESASAFPGLSAAPVKRVRKVTQSIVADASRSSGMRLPQVDTQVCDLVSAIAQVDHASAQPHGQDPQWEMRCRTVLKACAHAQANPTRAIRRRWLTSMGCISMCRCPRGG